MQVYSVQRRNHMCIIESGIATGSWRFARRVHRGVMRTSTSNIPCRTSTIRTINYQSVLSKYLLGTDAQLALLTLRRFPPAPTAVYTAVLVLNLVVNAWRVALRILIVSVYTVQ